MLVGVENLWRRGPTGGNRDYLDFGQYVSRSWFLAFQAAAGYMWAPKKYWYEKKHNKPWDIFAPAMDSFNSKRRKLISVVCMIMDESMIGWRPKTSKRGGLPNITYEPRKPGDCVTGILVRQDIAMDAEVQARKKYYLIEDDSLRRERTSLPGNPVMPAHTTEVLRQVVASGVIPGGWVGGVLGLAQLKHLWKSSRDFQCTQRV
ncbi:hypothetical protein IV203_026546 [Nitzschia inconspicua]|uniref:Uncharacterized protein n=1 Tax=Nitzschia inconspicua TaxID=303405 RepID=A0A9K3LLW4_9STRA|nr:hypothetical protein IV203_026546 [Nitzschia inconspicua]